MDIYKQTLDICLQRIKQNITRFGDQFPYLGNGNHYKLGANDHWMAGFWTGELWLAFAVSKDSIYREAAAAQLNSYRSRLENSVNISHDLGFLYTLSARAQYQICHDQTALDLGLAAANKLAERFNSHGEYIQAWGEVGDEDEAGRFIIDSMLNIPLLYWATAESGDPRYSDIANRHARTTMRHIMREDGSMAHTFFMNPHTGEPIGQKTHQGYSDNSLWTRGQAWAILGFAIAYEWSGDAQMLNAGRKAASRFLTELSSDKVPLWDFRLEEDAPQLRDTSAAVIAAMGFLRLANLLDEDSGQYSAFARQLIDAQIAAAFDPSPDGVEGLLGLSTYHATNSELAEQYTLFGDYFFFEALSWLCGQRTDFWGRLSSR